MRLATVRTRGYRAGVYAGDIPNTVIVFWWRNGVAAGKTIEPRSKWEKHIRGER